MNIIHLSDTHTHEKRITIVPCDLLVHTGDFCNIDFKLNREQDQTNTFNQAQAFLEWIEEYPAKYKVIISGNHETFLNNSELRAKFENLCKEKKIIFKDDMTEILEIDDLKIAGAGSYPHIAKYMPLKNAYFLKEGFYSTLPESHIDILISHVPPEVSGNQFECPDLKHWLRERIKYNNPIQLVLCGHIHETKGVYNISAQTSVINSSCELNPKLIEINPLFK